MSNGKNIFLDISMGFDLFKKAQIYGCL